MADIVVGLAEKHLEVDVEPLVRFGLKFAGVLARTPKDRIERAVKDEVADLVRRAREALAPGDGRADTPALREALDWLPQAEEFPRPELETLSARLRESNPDISDTLDIWIGKHRALEHRIKWLLGGTPPDRAKKLDPFVDTDELHHVVTSAFRFESRVVEMLAINRIAQSSTIGNFFRSTKEAEKNAVARFFDTYSLYANVFEWGLDSKRGGEAVQRMNQIHGRYYIPNLEIKFVLLQGAFTWLDGVDRIGHRRVTQNERQAMLCAWVRKGQAMNIQDMTENYDDMYAWYREVCEANAEHEQYKKDAFESIVQASLSGQLPQLRAGLFTAARVAMDPTYLSSVGYEPPTREVTAAVRGVFFTVGSMIEQLPYAPYLRSLLNNPYRRQLTQAGELGTPDRSKWMPKAFADRPNGGFPEWQKPIQSAEHANRMDLPEISAEEVAKHTTDQSLWLIWEGDVYDLTPMLEVHPGGATILRKWAGKDATRAFRGAKHMPGTITFSLNYRIGRLQRVEAPVLVAAE